MASVSPRHDTHPLIVAAGEFSVSILAGDQIVAGQYFSYPGHKLRYVADELLRRGPTIRPGRRWCPNAVAWLRCTTFQRMPMEDHELFFARVTAVVPGSTPRAAAAVLEPARLARHRRSSTRTGHERP